MKQTENKPHVLQKIRQFFEEKESFNYIYFGFFLVALLTINMCHILTIDQGSVFAKWFFVVYNVGQILIEVMLCVIISAVLKKWAPKWIYAFYIGFIFIFLFAQIIESILVKLMDVSFSEAIYLVFGADFANFIEMLRLTEIGMGVWIIVLAMPIAIPFLGIFIYKLTANISCKNPLYLKRKAFLSVLLVIPIALSFMDSLVSKNLLNTEYSNYKKVLPWKGTFFKRDLDKIHLKSPLKKMTQITTVLNEIEKHDFTIDKRPNIYLFVVESLRADYITQETAPNLVEFKNNHISATHSFSNANSTNNSWFSIFHSQYPFYWSYAKTSSLQEGSLPLNLLKKMGYKIHVYSSAQLRFYKFDEVILGKNKALADTFKVFPHYGDKTASDTDIEAIQAFQKDSKDHSKEGNVYLIFLDSTHFNYSWPTDFPEKFKPAEKITWEHRLSNDPIKLEILKNRYKNSIAFMDDLFSGVMQHLKSSGVYDESIVVFCGDHGEEFKEQGKLFHASHLNAMQTHIPLFYKFGKIQTQLSISSHVDIFPSIIHYVDKDTRFLKYFDGHSIFDGNRPDFAVIARYNACFHPYEFLIHNGKQHLMLKFDKKTNIFSSKDLKILGLYENFQERKVSKEEAFSSFSEALSSIFEIDSKKMDSL